MRKTMFIVVGLIVILSIGMGFWSSYSKSSPITENEDTINFVVITCFDRYGNSGDDYTTGSDEFFLTEEDNENKPLLYKDVVLNLKTGELTPFHNGDDYTYNTIIITKEQYDSLRQGTVNLDEYRDFTSMELVD